MTIFAIVCVIVVVVLGVLRLLAVPSGGDALAGGSKAAIPAEPKEARARLAAMVPPASAVIGELPQVTGSAGLSSVSAVEPPSVDLATIGCGEDRDEADAAVWQEVRRALQRRGGKASLPGGR